MPMDFALPHNEDRVKILPPDGTPPGDLLKKRRKPALLNLFLFTVNNSPTISETKWIEMGLEKI